MPDDKDKKKKKRKSGEDEFLDEISKNLPDGMDLGELGALIDSQYGDEVLTGSIDVTSPVWPSTDVHFKETVGDELKTFFNWDPQYRKSIQAILFAAGYYGDKDIDEIKWGVADDDSFAAWSAAVASAARAYAAGQKLGPKDVILNAAEAAGVDVSLYREKMESQNPADWFGPEDLPDFITEKGNLIQVMLSDPNGLRQTIDRSASAVLGRKATPAEQRAFVSMIHGVQRGGQTALQRAEAGAQGGGGPGRALDTGPDSDYRARADAAIADPTSAALGLGDEVPPGGDLTIEYAAPDEAADAEAMLRAQNPAEAGAHDIAIQMSYLMDMLGPTVNIPSLTLG